MRERPRLVVGFAAETEKLIDHAAAKLDRKGADFIVANDVSAAGATSAGAIMGGANNRVTIVSRAGNEAWPEMTKDEVAAKLAGLVADRLRD